MRQTSLHKAFIAEEETARISMGEATIIIKSSCSANDDYQKALRQYQLKYARKIENKQISEKEAQKIMASIVVDCLVVGWENMKEKVRGKWKEIPFSKDECTALFIDVPEALTKVMNEAKDVENFRKEEAEETAKK